MKNLLKLQKTFFIVALIIFFVFSIRYNVNAADDVYIDTTVSKKGDVIYFQKPADWGDKIPYIYAWDNYSDPQNKLDGKFPGKIMEHVSDNLYKYEFTENIPYTQVIFSDGSDNNKTKDLDYICNGYIYNFDDTANLSFSKIQLQKGDTIYFEKPDSWENNIFVYMWNSVSNNRNSDFGNSIMNNVSGNLYSYTLSDSDWNVSDGFDMIIFGSKDNNQQNKQQTKDLSTIGSNLIFQANNDTISLGENYGKYDGIWLYSSNQLTKLATLIQQKTIPTSDIAYYTKDSYAFYKEQYDLAKKVSNSTYVAATYSDLTSQYNKSLLALPFAYDNLKLNTQILSDKINEMNKVDTSKYEPTLVNSFKETIKNAENLLSNIDSITISNMKESINNMQIAYNNLVVDKTALEVAISKAEEIDTNLYTDESVKNLVNVLTTSTKVYENPDSSYLEVQEQITKINDAISKLVLKENENTENNINDTKDTSKEDNTTSNPHTGDTILTLVSTLIVAIITCTGTTLYLKKNRKHSKH